MYSMYTVAPCMYSAVHIGINVMWTVQLHLSAPADPHSPEGTAP